MTKTTWDPFDNGGWALSNSNLTATSPDNNIPGAIFVAFGTTSIPDNAETYFEFQVSGAAIQTAFTVGFGVHGFNPDRINVADEGAIIPNATFLGMTYNLTVTNTGDVIYDPQGNATYAQTHPGAIAAPNQWPDGSIIGVLVNRINYTAQFTLNGIPQGGPFDISGMIGQILYPFADSWYRSGPVATINGGINGFSEAIPTGYTALDEVACFLPGTLILTPNGETPVDRLVVGDLVLTRSGLAKRLIWIGYGKISVTPGYRCAATPVIIRKGALSDNVPHCDLRVTKGHSLYLNDALIPAEFLVNHRSILWDDMATEVTVFHLELETHEVLFANGAPAESYRDDGNRWMFQNPNVNWVLPPKQACAPVLTGGPMVDEVWQSLLDRAGPRPGFPLTEDPGLHMVVDGRRINALLGWEDEHVFRIPKSPTKVRIVSREAIPSELGVARDPRSLGVALRQIQIRRGARLTLIEASDERLVDGFQDYEPDDDLRWTMGDAQLPDEIFSEFGEEVEVTLYIAAKTSYALFYEKFDFAR